MCLLAAGCPLFNSRSMCSKVIPIGTPAGVRKMPPEVDILPITGGLALALFRIPIDHRQAAEYNSNSLGVTHNLLHASIVCRPHDTNRQPAIRLCRHTQAVLWDRSFNVRNLKIVRHRGQYSFLIEITPSHYAASDVGI